MNTLDARLFFAIFAAHGGAFTPIALFLSLIGGGWAMVGLVPLYLFAPRWRRLTLTLTATLASSATLVYLLKLTVARPRPCVSLDGVHALCAAPSDPSFPSGHACGSFTFATFLLVLLYVPGGISASRPLREVVAGMLVALALGVGWSRVYLGVHFPGDVAVGASLGVLAGLVGGRLYARETLNQASGRPVAG
jgi:membrane-associated phospholipid phosphatase